jgi:hypothetical protein
MTDEQKMIPWSPAEERTARDAVANGLSSIEAYSILFVDRIKRYEKALAEIRDTPYSMVNDSESLRYSCRVMTDIAHKALKQEK